MEEHTDIIEQTRCEMWLSKCFLTSKSYVSCPECYMPSLPILILQGVTRALFFNSGDCAVREFLLLLILY